MTTSLKRPPPLDNLGTGKKLIIRAIKCCKEHPVSYNIFPSPSQLSLILNPWIWLAKHVPSNGPDFPKCPSLDDLLKNVRPRTNLVKHSIPYSISHLYKLRPTYSENSIDFCALKCQMYACARFELNGFYWNSTQKLLSKQYCNEKIKPITYWSWLICSALGTVPRVLLLPKAAQFFQYGQTKAIK